MKKNDDSMLNKEKLNKTIEILQKYWIFIIGFILVFASLLYFIKVGYDEGWIPPVAIVFIGIITSGIVFFASTIIYKKEFKIISEIFAGFACGIIYATIIYADFADIWIRTITFIVLCFVSLVIFVINYKSNLRVFTSLEFSAALFAPFIVTASELHIPFLFSYCFVINIIIIGFYIIKKWKELPLIGLIITGVLYFAYYKVINPVSYFEPFIYITLIFLIYKSGIIISLKRENTTLDKLSIILIYFNSLLYGCWTIYLFNAFSITPWIPLLILGFISLVIAGIINSLLKDTYYTALVFFCLGLFLLAISSFYISRFIAFRGLNNLIRSGIFLGISLIVYLVGYKLKKFAILTIGTFLWIIVLLYWYRFAWDTGTVQWFGVEYIPFINPAAILWISIIFSGFFISVTFKNLYDKLEENQYGKYLFIILPIICHIAVGGLLTLQVKYLWDFYPMPFNVNLIYSILWGFYSFILFLWGYLNKEKLFILFADFVLIIVVVKVIFFDLSGDTSIYKMLILLITGIIIIFIGFLNYKMQSAKVFKEKQQEKKTKETKSDMKE